MDFALTNKLLALPLDPPQTHLLAFLGHVWYWFIAGAAQFYY